ncbi:DUF1877 domain-containing protein [Schumannella sp. 10F1B-5-1]|uniref:DUF1877 domain-containing protein n=1 Tax=Schumannella sp. 10F1B-5-1 TaxID=2590780 RepID=UPI0011317E9F|nr:DUF1877 domain-containing protein [Schumannella sp. 10F1B-5-1]TPW73100.1 DUF1877 domain-containing protein [Schumannella sp. 10F1B-5-1]
MGIRYYAYAFDADQTEQVFAEPRRFLSSDPLADAWGMEPHVSMGTATFRQRSSERDMLYLDKAWRELQILTLSGVQGGPARDSHRLFAGRVTMHEYGWESWVSVIAPDEVAPIQKDLVDLDEAVRLEHSLIPESSEDDRYVADYLHRARVFVDRLAEDGRGLVYLIG